jgi:hypothetical protein
MHAAKVLFRSTTQRIHTYSGLNQIPLFAKPISTLSILFYIMSSTESTTKKSAFPKSDKARLEHEQKLQQEKRENKWIYLTPLIAAPTLPASM